MVEGTVSDSLLRLGVRKRKCGVKTKQKYTLNGLGHKDRKLQLDAKKKIDKQENPKKHARGF